VQEHPILTTLIVVSVVATAGMAVTYIFYPHLLGFASAVGGVGVNQVVEDQIKQAAKASAEALAESARQLAEANARLALAESSKNILQTQLTEKSAEVIAERGLRVAAEAAKEFIQIKSPTQEGVFRETLTRVLLENPPQVGIDPQEVLRVGVDRTNLLQYSFMDSIQLTHNILLKQPIKTPLPEDMLEKAVGASQQCMDLTIQIFLS